MPQIYRRTPPPKCDFNKVGTIRLIVRLWLVDFLLCGSEYIPKTEHIIIHVGTNGLYLENSSERIAKSIVDLEIA